MCIRDSVAGVRTPMHISEMEQKFPEAFVQFKQVCETLETVSYTHLENNTLHEYLIINSFKEVTNFMKEIIYEEQ